MCGRSLRGLCRIPSYISATSRLERGEREREREREGGREGREREREGGEGEREREKRKRNGRNKRKEIKGGRKQQKNIIWHNITTKLYVYAPFSKNNNYHTVYRIMTLYNGYTIAHVYIHYTTAHPYTIQYMYSS